MDIASRPIIEYTLPRVAKGARMENRRQEPVTDSKNTRISRSYQDILLAIYGSKTCGS